MYRKRIIPMKTKTTQFRDFTIGHRVPLQSTMAAVSAMQTAHGQFAFILHAALASVDTGEPPVQRVH